MNSSYPTARRTLFLKPQIVIHCHGNLLLGTEIAFGDLDGEVAEQELDLFDISAASKSEGSKAAFFGRR
jgi:hypothetical protein